MTRQIGQGGLALLREFEQGPGGGPALRMYYCPAGKPTIGYGHVIRLGERFAEPITPEQADGILVADAASCAQSVEYWTKVPLSQNEFDALCVFVFNEGAPRFYTSTLLRELNKGNKSAVPDELRKWDKFHDPSTGKIRESAGLLRRRNAEAALWETPDAA